MPEWMLDFSLLGMPFHFWTVVFAILGALWGSFLNVCIHRLPLKQSVVHPGSRCPDCGYALRWYDNVPVVSYATLRGRCRSCARPISTQYPIIELVTVVTFVLHRPAVSRHSTPLKSPSAGSYVALLLKS